MDSDLYRDILGFAHDTPEWFQFLAEVWTELGLLVFAALFIAGWWRARTLPSGAMAAAVLAPLGTGVAYVCSEALKSLVDEDRPCRAVARAAAPLVSCPPVGDWSFPSNHSTIAGAAAVGLALAWPRLAWFTVPMALLMALSRVFVGVHYPHDVAAGLLLGALVSLVFVRLGRRPMTRLVDALRGAEAGLPRWLSGTGADDLVTGAGVGRHRR
ncbi:phosphatase PAP2 family protein [Streptomyces sp. NPDC060194]|uniref:phosphatase PAP2 family protein n=1 Tax=Streptomyces sp. NPDC060194 TaxID=3347069 RepID=UPI00364D511A